jgi:hypothetical protein
MTADTHVNGRSLNNLICYAEGLTSISAISKLPAFRLGLRVLRRKFLCDNLGVIFSSVSPHRMFLRNSMPIARILLLFPFVRIRNFIFHAVNYIGPTRSIKIHFW